jgi:DNA ligase (NAD+)
MTSSADSLANELRTATVAYTSGNPIMTDAVFDAKEDHLRRIAPTHPYFSEVGSPSGDGWSKVTHPIPMGSLDKAQTEDEFLAWAAKVGAGALQPIFVSHKMDGISLLLVYEKGELVRAATRGDGLMGQDITRNARIMKGVSSHVPYDGTLYIRGEVVCRKSDHAEHFPDESNPRNTAAGKSVAQSDWRRAQHLTFYAYNVSSADSNHGAESRSKEFEILKGWGFNVPGHNLVQNPKSVIEMREDYINGIRDRIDYDIDGLVIEIDDTEAREALGHHNYRPKGAIAFKFPHDAKSTTLRDIVWQVGPSGRVTPVAQFDAVDLAGASVKQASLHNVKRVTKLKLFRDCSILVSRRNDVIPMVEANLDLGIYINDDEDL